MTAGAVTLGAICGGLMSPVRGLLADRFGARVLTPIGSLVVSLALL